MNIEEFREYCLSFLRESMRRCRFPMCPTNIAVTFYAFMQRTNGSVSLTLRFPIFVVSNATLTNPENCKLNIPA